MVPWTTGEHSEESLKDYNDFMRSYKEQHKFCPKCKAISHTTTLMGYVLHSDKREEYKDLNSCVCQECGDYHTFHERVS